MLITDYSSLNCQFGIVLNIFDKGLNKKMLVQCLYSMFKKVGNIFLLLMETEKTYSL